MANNTADIGPAGRMLGGIDTYFNKLYENITNIKLLNNTALIDKNNIVFSGYYNNEYKRNNRTSLFSLCRIGSMLKEGG